MFICYSYRFRRRFLCRSAARRLPLRRQLVCKPFTKYIASKIYLRTGAEPDIINIRGLAQMLLPPPQHSSKYLCSSIEERNSYRFEQHE